MRYLEESLFTDRDLYLSLIQRSIKGPGLDLKLAGSLILLSRLNSCLAAYLTPPT